MLLVSAAIALLALVTTALLVMRRRRAARGPALSVRMPRAPAGVSHLAARVSDLSDLDMHLHAGVAQRRRLGALLGSSSGASR
ncbi:MAG TPA: hypothetical protein VF841_19705 [Anaeromyxobacter sp.]